MTNLNFIEKKKSTDVAPRRFEVTLNEMMNDASIKTYLGYVELG